VKGDNIKSSASRYASLREYFPNAKDAEWELIVADQRVQVIVRMRSRRNIGIRNEDRDRGRRIALGSARRIAGRARVRWR